MLSPDWRPDTNESLQEIFLNGDGRRKARRWELLPVH